MSCKNLYKQPYIHIEPQFAEVHFERPMSRVQLDQLKNDDNDYDKKDYRVSYTVLLYFPAPFVILKNSGFHTKHLIELAA